MEKIEAFLSEYFKCNIYTYTPINNSASARKYYRVLCNSKNYILTSSENVLENKTFLYFNEKLKEINIKVPNIVWVSSDYTLYLQEDLGDVNLLSRIQTGDSIESLLNTCIKDLVIINTQLPKVLDFAQCYEFRKLSKELIINDFFYFKNYFLEYLEIPFQKEKLIQDFFSISEEIKNLPNSFFLYRDFQSRNIMIYEDTPYYIDFQGGMEGIACYDFVSFTWQAKAQFSKDTKERLKQRYFTEMQKHANISIEELEKSYNLSLILRLYQLLGAYGFRGLVQQKSHFKESIYNAVENIQYLLENRMLENYPALKLVTETHIQNSKLNI